MWYGIHIYIYIYNIYIYIFFCSVGLGRFWGVRHCRLKGHRLLLRLQQWVPSTSLTPPKIWFQLTNTSSVSTWPICYELLRVILDHPFFFRLFEKKSSGVLVKWSPGFKRKSPESFTLAFLLLIGPSRNTVHCLKIAWPLKNTETMVQKSGEKTSYLPVFTKGFVHPRWWSPDFWTINSSAWETILFFWGPWPIFNGWTVD